MDTFDEIPLEDHRFFRARLAHLESHQPKMLLDHLEKGTLTSHLRNRTSQAIKALGELVLNKQIPPDQAEELVMNQIVADPQEPVERLSDLASRRTLHLLLREYRKVMSMLPRTYQSQIEITG